MSDSDTRIPRRASSIKIEKWGLVESWLSRDPERLLLLSNGAKGFQVTAIDPQAGEMIELISATEEPSDAALRAISRF